LFALATAARTAALVIAAAVISRDLLGYLIQADIAYFSSAILLGFASAFRGAVALAFGSISYVALVEIEAGGPAAQYDYYRY